MLLCVISGCANPYSKFYQDCTGGQYWDESRIITSTGEPKLRQGINPKDYEKNMLEDGYCLIGRSCFNSDVGSVNHFEAVEQAKKIHADTVIVYDNYTHTVSGVRPLVVPDMRTGTAYHSGTIYDSGGGFANYSGSSQITTYGSSTTYVPYKVDRYDCFATYWVKVKPPRLGIYSKDLTDELRKKVGSNKGIYITVVVKDSPAFNSDLLAGDVIRRVNGIEVIDQDHYLKWLNETHPSAIDFEIFRNGENITKRVQPQYSDSATGAVPTGEYSQPTTTDQNASTNKTSKEAPVDNAGRFISQVGTCSICGRTIPKLEQHFMVDEKIVCKDCFAKLKSQN
jgi:DNA-directed RNA polymerase subunit RPC12/RpoP